MSGKVVVCGSREWMDQKFLYDTLDAYFPTGATMVNGAARGADHMATTWALDHAVPIDFHEANWDKWGKAAGPRRNVEMMNTHPVLVIAFHANGSSPGTEHMIKLCIERGVPVFVFPQPLP